MQDVPKIVRERLKAAPAPVDHPDPDVLTAFAEHSLPQAERTQVVVHLSRCVDCRDIVALALPPSEATQLVVTPLRAGWLTWPALRWGFVAVGVVAIASVGLVQYQRGKSTPVATRIDSYVEGRRDQSAPQAVAEPQTTSATQTTPAPHTGAAQLSAGANKANATSASGDKLLAKPSEPVPSAPKALDTAPAKQAGVRPSQYGLNIGGPVMRNKVFTGGPAVAWQQQQGMQQQVPAASARVTAPAAPAPIPPAVQAVRVAPAMSAPQAQAGATELAQNAPSPQAPQDEIKRTKPPETVTVEVTAAAPLAETADSTTSQQEMPKAVGLDGRNVTQLVVLAPGSAMRWTISPSGNLLRSYDQGGTWQNVNVIATLISTSNFATYDANSVSIVAKAKKSDKKDRTRDLPTPVFRAVTAAGSDVWAGGSNAALYHSTDGGDHWIQVLPSSGGAALTGDVVVLEFPDPQHGRVMTSAPEMWTTSDAGQTWQKQ